MHPGRKAAERGQRAPQASFEWAVRGRIVNVVDAQRKCAVNRLHRRLVGHRSVPASEPGATEGKHRDVDARPTQPPLGQGYDFSRSPL